MNFVIQTWFHQIPGVRYKMIRTKLAPAPSKGAVIEIQDTDFEPQYFFDRSQAEKAQARELAGATSPVCSIYDFINLSDRVVAKHFADELATDSIDAQAVFFALPSVERAIFRIRYVETVVCPARTVARAVAA